MAQALVISLFAVMCLIGISEVLSEDCAAYVNPNLQLVKHQSCALLSCGGTCTNRYCTLLGQLDQTQFMCLLNNLYVIIGVSITCSVLLIASICACCWKCCFITYLATNRAV